MVTSFNRRETLLLLTIAGSMLAVLALGEIRQDPSYHDFADKRAFFGLQNFFDVISNLPFVLVGAAGFFHCLRRKQPLAVYSWPVLFAGVVLVGFGSAYYHLNPDASTLVWDRLPMAVSFMGLFVALLSENISPRIERVALIPAALMGLASVLYWHFTGDLRPYVWIQIVPLLTMLMVLLLFRDRYSHWRYLMIALIMYLLAKIAELGDEPLFRITGEQLSGHTLKHLLAAAGAYALISWIKKRRRANS